MKTESARCRITSPEDPDWFVEVTVEYPRIDREEDNYYRNEIVSQVEDLATTIAGDLGAIEPEDLGKAKREG